MNKGKRRVPKLRFPGFTEDWEQRKFGELFILKSGVAFKLSEYTKNGIPIINGESIKAGKISLEKVNYLPNEYQYKYQECLLFPGDIVLGLNRPIIDGELKISRIPSDIKTSLLYQRAGKIIFKVNMEENFTYQLLSKEVLTFTRREAVGSDQPFITTTKLNKWDLCLPVKDEERRMIGNLLDNINNIITLHQRKLEHLNLKKKTLLQKLFPKNGERYPELRFPGFTDAWEQRKLSELATMNARIGWQNLRTSEFLDSGDYLLITGTDFDNGRIKYNTCHYVEKKRFDQDTKIQLSTGSILITKDGTLGKVALIEELPKPATLNAGVFNVRVKDDAVLSYKYLYHYLKAPFLMKYVTANATGGTIKHLNQSILVDFPIPITEKQEQDRIAKLLDSLESIITLHQ